MPSGGICFVLECENIQADHEGIYFLVDEVYSLVASSSYDDFFVIAGYHSLTSRWRAIVGISEVKAGSDSINVVLEQVRTKFRRSGVVRQVGERQFGAEAKSLLCMDDWSKQTSRVCLYGKRYCLSALGQRSDYFMEEYRVALNQSVR
jgi:hypothetical protein